MDGIVMEYIDVVDEVLTFILSHDFLYMYDILFHQYYFSQGVICFAMNECINE